MIASKVPDVKMRRASSRASGGSPCAAAGEPDSSTSASTRAAFAWSLMTAPLRVRARVGAALEQARAHRREPAHERRVLAQDRLGALGAGRDEAEGHAHQLLEPLDVAACLRRQVGLVPGADGRGPPALDLLVDGLGLDHDVLVLRELREDGPPVPVGHPSLYRLALIQDG